MYVSLCQSLSWCVCVPHFPRVLFVKLLASGSGSNIPLILLNLFKLAEQWFTQVYEIEENLKTKIE